MKQVRLFACALAASLLGDPASAKMPGDVFVHYQNLEQLLNRSGNPFSTVFGFENDCVYKHIYGKNIAPGTWIDRITVIDFADLDVVGHRIEDREDGIVKMMIVPLRENAAAVTHALEMTDMKGAMHQRFLDLYGGDCDDMYCDATLEDREVFITVVGDTATTDIETVASAVTGLAHYCATADSEGG